MKRIVLDTGALIALERRNLYMIALQDLARQGTVDLLTVSGVIAQYWRGGSGRQTPVARLLRSEALRVDELTTGRARELGKRVLSIVDVDVTDAHVAWLAEQLHGTVVTSDPDDIRAISKGIDIQTI